MGTTRYVGLRIVISTLIVTLLSFPASIITASATPIRPAQHTTWDGWSRTWNNNGWYNTSAPIATGTDGNGNVYISGELNGTIDFDPTNGVDSKTATGMYLTKYDSDGTYLWTQTWENMKPEFMKVTANGKIIMTGFTYGAVDLDPTSGVDSYNATFVGGSLSDTFTVYMNADGSYGWGSVIGDSTATGGSYRWAYSNAITVLPNGDVAIAGSFDGSINFNPDGTSDVHNAPPEYDNDGRANFLTRWSSNGTYLGTQSWNLFTNSYTFITSDLNSNIYVGSRYYGTATFNPNSPQAITNVGNGGVYISTFDSSGNYVSTYLTDNAGQYASSIWLMSLQSDSEGYLYMYGSYSQNTDMDHDGTNDLIGSGSYMAKLTPNGQYQWIRQVPSQVSAYTWGAFEVVNDVIYLTGTFSGSTNFGFDGSSHWINGPGAFIARYNSDGSYRSAEGWGSYKVTPADLTVTGDGILYLVGQADNAGRLNPYTDDVVNADDTSFVTKWGTPEVVDDPFYLYTSINSNAGGNIKPGDEVTFQLTATSYSSPEILDTLNFDFAGNGLEVTDVSVSSGVGTYDFETNTWSGTLNTWGSFTLTITTVALSSAGGSNGSLSFEITGGRNAGKDIVFRNDSVLTGYYEVYINTAPANLLVTSQLSPQNISAGSNVTYTVTISNEGAASTTLGNMDSALTLFLLSPSISGNQSFFHESFSCTDYGATSSLGGWFYNQYPNHRVMTCQLSETITLDPNEELEISFNSTASSDFATNSTRFISWIHSTTDPRGYNRYVSAYSGNTKIENTSSPGVTTVLYSGTSSTTTTTTTTTSTTTTTAPPTTTTTTTTTPPTTTTTRPPTTTTVPPTTRPTVTTAPSTTRPTTTTTSPLVVTPQEETTTTTQPESVTTTTGKSTVDVDDEIEVKEDSPPFLILGTMSVTGSNLFDMLILAAILLLLGTTVYYYSKTKNSEI